MRNTKPIAGALAMLLLAAPASAAPTPTSSPAPQPNVLQRDAVLRQSVQPDPRAALRARFLAVSALPRRTFRAATSVRSLETAGARQDVRLAAVNPDRPYTRDAQYCAQHPLLLDRVTGEVTPGGTLTVTGACFGSGAGTMQMIGNFPPSGRVSLVIQSWADDRVTAQLPAVTGAPDQPVELELEHFAPNPTARVQRHDVQAVSPHVRMSFVAQREARSAIPHVANGSCARGDHPADVTQCGTVYTWPSDYFCGDYGCGWADHKQSAADSGTDTWYVHLPPGWRFEHIEAQGPVDAVTIDPTLDPANVTWSIRWHTTHVAEKREWKHSQPPATFAWEQVTPAYDTAGYLFYVFATGPAGTYK